jgi:hypothetical protein
MSVSPPRIPIITDIHVWRPKLFWGSITMFARANSTSSFSTRAESSAFLRTMGSVGFRPTFGMDPVCITRRDWLIDDE